jgi:hypothetical protein
MEDDTFDAREWMDRAARSYDLTRANNIIEQLKDMGPESRDVVVQYVLSEYLSR